jgi:tRNA pseudouridine32 synthase/23S rRNA pseudouridine746 synthase
LEDLPRQRVDWEHGKEAVTLYEVIGQEEKGTRVRFYPQTGRTHQLRVHAAAKEGLNAPIVGDRLYGHVADRLYLHAEALDFTHPVTHERMHFEAPAPF